MTVPDVPHLRRVAGEDAKQPSVDPRVVLDAAVPFFNSADETLSRRLAASQTVVQLQFTDAEPQGLTLFYDRDPVVCEEGLIGDAEVQIYISVDCLTRVLLGIEPLALLIAKGEVSYSGPVRKFLRATPMMRKLDVDHLRPLAAAHRKARAPTDSEEQS